MKCPAFLVAALATLPLCALAQQAPSTTVSLSASSFKDAELDGSGKAGLTSSTLSVAHQRSVADKQLGLQLRLVREDWAFKGNNGFGGAPWGKVERYTLAAPLSERLANGWMLTLAPRVEVAREEEARTRKSMIYGLSAMGLNSFGENRRAGFGLATQRTVEGRYTVVPLLLVDWALSSSLRLSNPKTQGPMGLELSFTPGQSLTFAGGFAMNESRFRLADDNARAAGGVGQYSTLPVFLRLSWAPAPAFSMDATVGTLTQGKLKLRNSAGHELHSEDLKKTPFCNLNASFRF